MGPGPQFGYLDWCLLHSYTSARPTLTLPTPPLQAPFYSAAALTGQAATYTEPHLTFNLFKTDGGTDVFRTFKLFLTAGPANVYSIQIQQTAVCRKALQPPLPPLSSPHTSIASVGGNQLQAQSAELTWSYCTNAAHCHACNVLPSSPS
jgi:hypothetical protein